MVRECATQQENVRHSLRFVAGVPCHRKDIKYAVLEGKVY